MGQNLAPKSVFDELVALFVAAKAHYRDPLFGSCLC
jgi:hypothetical protein